MCARARLGAQAVEHERDEGRVLDMHPPVGGVRWLLYCMPRDTEE